MPESMAVVPWLLFLFVVLFAFGSAVGSFLNVVIARLPAGVSLYRPPSRCGSCLTPIARRDNLPLISYWRLKGRCRTCGVPFSLRYFWAELLTGLGFVAIYLVDVVFDFSNHYYPFGGYWYLSWGVFPPGSWVMFAFHAVLLSFLIVCGMCVWDNGKAPRSVLTLGAVVGLVGATCFPWPWPSRAQEAAQLIPSSAALTRASVSVPTNLSGDKNWATTALVPRSGMYVLPVWGPPPAELPAGDPRLGLATGLAGLVAGALLSRSLLLLCRRNFGSVSIGDGEGDYLAVAGAFLGWQPVAVAAMLAVVPAALLARSAHLTAGPSRYPLGPVLILSTIATWFGWRWLGPLVQPLLFNRDLVLGVSAVLALLVLVGFLGKASGRPALVAPNTAGPQHERSAEEVLSNDDPSSFASEETVV